MSDESYRGRLLVAHPTLLDANFHRTAVLVLEHGPLGALGVVLNRPSGSPVAEILPAWESRSAPPAVVFIGGPVSPQSAIGLAAVDAALPHDDGAPTFAGIGVVDLANGPETLAAPAEGVRVFAGCAGWAAGQLDREIDAGGWFVVDLEHDDALTAHPAQLWRSALARQPGRLGWVANFPDDPRAN